MTMKNKLLVFLFLLCGTLVYAETQVRNAGTGGWSTKNAVNAFYNSVADYDPDTVILEFGTNDSINPEQMMSLEQFDKNYRQLVQLVKKSGVKKIAILTVGPIIESYLRGRFPNHPEKGDLNQKILKYNDVIRKLAKEGNLTLIDMHALVMQNGGTQESETSFIRNLKNKSGKDGVHLTAKGYQVLAAEIAKNFVPGKKVVCYGDSLTFGANLAGAGTVTGENYPSYLWKIWNPELANAKKQPTPLASVTTVAGNLVRNGSFTKASPEGLPTAWVLWKKNQDSAKQMTEEGFFGKQTYVRLIGAPNSSAFLRSDFIRRNNISYLLKCKVRGKGVFVAGIGQYEGKPAPVMQDLKKMDLTDQWTELSLPFEIPEQCLRMIVYFRTTGEADISDCILSVGKKKTADTPAVKYSLAQGKVSYGFADAAEGGGMVRLTNANGVDFLNVTPSGMLWTMTLRKIKTDKKDLPTHVTLTIDPEQDDRGSGGEDAKSMLRLSSVQAKELGGTASVRQISPKHLVMEWKNLRVGNEKDALDVSVQIIIKDDGSCYFQGGFSNRSKEFTVYYFDCPCVDGLGGVRGEFAADRLATPFFNGRLIADPVRKGLLGSNTIFQPNRSGHSMHFDVFSNGNDSLYLAVQDPSQYAKRWKIASSPEHGLSWNVVNIPDNMRHVPQKWEMPYQAQIHPFSGDWFDGCMIYRKWALRQFWCANGELESRKDIPVWFKELTEWFQGSPEEALTKNSKFIQNYKKFRLGAWVYYWGKDRRKGDCVMTPDRFPLQKDDLAMLKHFHENNVKVMGYIQCTGWPESSESYLAQPDAVENMVRNYYGQFICWPRTKTSKGNHTIAYPGPLWEKILGDHVVQMAENGFDAAYLDSGNHGGTYLNFTPACSKESGGGIGYVHGNMHLLKSVRERARKIRPDFCTTAESFWEGNIGCLDAFLVCNTTNAYLERNRVTAIPMIHAVYHDHTLLYSAWTGVQDVEQDDAMGFVAKHAQTLCWGVKPGWAVMGLFYKYKNNEIVRETTRYRYEAYERAKKFLVYGEMMRPPKILSPVKELPVKWNRSYGPAYWETLIPETFAAFWKAQDNSRAVVAYNIGTKPYQAEIEIPGSYKTVTPLYPDKLDFSTETKGAKTILKIRMPARIPVIIEMKKGK